MKNFPSLLTVFLVCLASRLPAAAEAPKLRLPDTVTPLQCALDLTVLPLKGTVSGTVDLEVQVKEATPVLWLNASKLRVEQAAFVPEGGKAIQAQPRLEGDDWLGLTFPRIVQGRGHLVIRYKGTFDTREATGIFARKDGDATYAYTQFESVYARKAFPCFDEPGFKIPWQVTLHVAKGNVAFTNTPLMGRTEENGMATYRFARTRPLPSYLVAFAVGPFETVDAGYGGMKGAPLRVIVPRGHAAEAAYAVENLPRILGLLEEYFGTALPSSKLDALAVPDLAGAMENPGLITYDMNLILARPGQDSIQFRRNFIDTAAHEMAHQWFGDLVTPAWWNDLWLNEGFASWMGPRIVERLKPEWDTKGDRAAAMNRAMAPDALVAARMIRQPIETKGDIINAFDDITYYKGAALIGMFEHYLGEEPFRKGVRRFLKAHADGIATTADFLNALTGDGAPAAFSTFLDKPGVPVVTGELRPGPGGTSLLTLTQRRFFPVGSKGTGNQLWQIPVSIRSSAQGKVRRTTHLLTSASTEITLPFPPSSLDYLLLNDGQAGYYHTIYRGQLLQKLLERAEENLSVPEQVGLMADVAAAASVGELTRREALALVPGFRHHTNHQVQAFLAALVKGIQDNFFPEEFRPNYVRFVQKMYGEKARTLGLQPAQGESEDTRLLRATLVALVGDAGEDPTLRAAARKLALQWLEDRKALDPSIVEVVLRLAAIDGDKALFDRFLAEARKTKDREDLEKLFPALGSFRAPALASAALELTLSDAFEPIQTLAILETEAGANSTRPLVLAFLAANIDKITARLPLESCASLPLLGAGFCEEARGTELQAIFKDRLEAFPGAARNLARTVETIRLNAAVSETQTPSVEALLEDY